MTENLLCVLLLCRPDGSDCKVFVGDMLACGTLFNDEKHLKLYLDSASKAYGGEMEAWGLYQACAEAAAKGHLFA